MVDRLARNADQSKMAARSEIGSDKPFSAMTVDERDRLLLELRQKLQDTASLSYQLKSRHWQKLEKIANRIEIDRAELANDYSDKSNRFVSDAIHALAEFDKETASYIRHAAGGR